MSEIRRADPGSNCGRVGQSIGWQDVYSLTVENMTGEAQSYTLYMHPLEFNLSDTAGRNYTEDYSNFRLGRVSRKYSLIHSLARIDVEKNESAVFVLGRDVRHGK